MEDGKSEPPMGSDWSAMPPCDLYTRYTLNVRFGIACEQVNGKHTHRKVTPEETRSRELVLAPPWKRPWMRCWWKLRGLRWRE